MKNIKNNVLKFVSAFSLAVLFPALALAADPVVLKTSSGCPAGLANLFCRLTQLLNYVLPFLVALGVVYLVWGIVKYVIGDSEEAKKKGRDTMIFGIIGLAVIVCVWGLVYIVINTFFDTGSTGVAPGPAQLNNLLPGQNNSPSPDINL